MTPEAKEPSSLLRLSTLGLLYFVQGAPYGFQTACLPLILREAGLSFSALGAMKLLFVPWVCKPLYAPFVEHTKSKEWWLTVTMLAMTVTCWLCALVAGPDRVTEISLCMFILNGLSAAQDVATDSLAVRILAPSELGMGNTVQVVAYKGGSVLTGGVLIWTSHRFGWPTMFFLFGSIYLACVALLKSLSLISHSSKATSSDATTGNPKGANTLSWGQTLKALFEVKGTLYVIFFVSVYKLCERAEQTFSLVMVDKKVPMEQMAFWSTVMRATSVLGSTYGGFLLSRGMAKSGRIPGEQPSVAAESKRLILRYCALRALPIAAQCAILNAWGALPADDQDAQVFSKWGRDSLFMYAGFACTTCTLFCAGVVTTATFTLMMHVSQQADESVKGTHYVTLATFEILGKLAFASVSGWLIDWLGLEPMYCVFLLLAVGCVPLIYFAPSCLTEQRRKAQ